MIYLASPYSHNDSTIREKRFDAVCEAAARMMCEGELVFTPIGHSHPISVFGTPKGWDFWGKFDCWFIKRCDKVVVLMLEGWETSVGVSAEIALANQFGKPVEYLKGSFEC